MNPKLYILLICVSALLPVATSRAEDVRLTGRSGCCDGVSATDEVVDFSGLSLSHEASLSYSYDDSATHETLRGVASIRRDYAADTCGMRMTRMETRGRYLSFDEGVPVAFAKNSPISGEGRRFVSELFGFEGTATVTTAAHSRLIMAAGDTITDVTERRVTISGVCMRADSEPAAVTITTLYFYAGGRGLPVAIVDNAVTGASAEDGGAAAVYLFPLQENAPAMAEGMSPQGLLPGTMMRQNTASAVEVAEVMVCDTMGRIIYRTACDESGYCTMPCLMPGHYVLTIITADGMTQSRTVYVNE